MNFDGIVKVFCEPLCIVFILHLFFDLAAVYIHFKLSLYAFQVWMQVIIHIWQLVKMIYVSNASTEDWVS